MQAKSYSWLPAINRKDAPINEHDKSSLLLIFLSWKRKSLYEVVLSKSKIRSHYSFVALCPAAPSSRKQAAPTAREETDRAFPDVFLSADQLFLTLWTPRPLLGLIYIEKVASIAAWVNAAATWGGVLQQQCQSVSPQRQP